MSAIETMSDQKMGEQVELEVKRKRGRPRKEAREVDLESSTEDKRPVGRPRKGPREASAPTHPAKKKDGRSRKRTRNKRIKKSTVQIALEDLDPGSEPTEEKKKRQGRPLKYTALLAALDDNVAYCGGSIVEHAISLGLHREFVHEDDEDFKDWCIKVRHTMACMAKNHGFPRKGDKMVLLHGQPMYAGWFGSRWKKAAGLPLGPVQVGEGESTAGG